MEPVDAVKLAYQSAFGCGHLITQACAQAVRDELARTPVRADMPAATPIGGGLCRLNLAAPAVHGVPPERIADMMRLTAQAPLRGESWFWEGVAALRALARTGDAPFTPQALESYLDGYRELRPVSHSAAYRAAYAPAYRVVLEDLGTLVPVIAEAERRLAAQGRVLMVLDGPCGSGKTTLAGALGALYRVQPIHLDDFFLLPELRTADRLAQPGGNVHYERFLDEVLAGLLRGGNVAYRRYDCQTGAWVDRLHRDASVTVIEGSYSHHPAFRDAYERLDALRVFIYTDGGEQERRLRARDPQRFAAFQTRWMPLEKSYLKAYDIKSGANIALVSHPWA